MAVHPSTDGAPRERAERRPIAVSPAALAKRLTKRSVLLCLDYDGTLVPIAGRPELATFDDSGRRLLRGLSRRMPVAIVSGRARAALRSLIGVPSLYYVGNHGFEISGPRVRLRAPLPPDWPRELERLLTTIESDAPPGVLIERKGPTASVHYRLVAPEDRRRWLPALRARLDVLAGDGHLRVLRGKTVLELRPPGHWHKGAAVRWLTERRCFTGRIPVYLGDDATDEDAFRAIRHDGIGVLVGPSRRTAARYRLPGPAHVRRFIEQWLGESGSDERPR
ncbi:MAG TPA: trehalose-phosphatase [Nitrospiria bacterium]|nr:trehalose-phosphatase [Nitrospiria bacterium]